MEDKKTSYWITAGLIVSAVITLISGYLAFSQADNSDISESEKLFDALALLVLEDSSGGHSRERKRLRSPGKRVSAIVFVLFGVYGLIRAFGDLLFFQARWIFNRINSTQKRPVIILGLGSIGLPLALEHRRKRDIVYAISLDEEDDYKEVQKGEGILLLEGDAGNEELLAKLIKRRTKFGVRIKEPRIYIATGSDTRNIEIALDVERVARRANQRAECYLHLANPDLSDSIKSSEILSEGSDHITFRTFNIQDVTSYDFLMQLYLNQGLGVISDKPHQTNSSIQLPKADEVVHIFIFGFGKTAQNLALHVARFSHFESHLRPRITIIADKESGRSPWIQFLERYPAFSPPDLNLEDMVGWESFDEWDISYGRPIDRLFKVTPLSEDDIPIEYAANAEYLDILQDIEGRDLIDTIVRRIRTSDRKVHAAIAFCHEDEQRNFEEAMHLREELAKVSVNEKERSLREAAENLDRLEQLREDFVSGSILSVTYPSSFEQFNTLISQIYRAVRDCSVESYPLDYESKRLLNEVKCLHGRAKRNDYIRLPEIPDLTTFKKEARSLTRNKISEDVDAFAAWKVPFGIFLPNEDSLTRLLEQRIDKPRGYRDHAFPIVPFGSQKDVVTPESVTHSRVADYARNFRSVYESITNNPGQNHVDFEESDRESVLFSEVKLKTIGITFRPFRYLNDKILPESVASRIYLNLFEGYHESTWNRVGEAKAELRRILYPFTNAEEHLLEQYESVEEKIEAENRITLLPTVGERFDMAAEMEHNRWMAERLTRNWRYGERDTWRMQRDSFRPWNQLMNRYRNFDRQSIIQILIIKYRKGYLPEYED